MQHPEHEFIFLFDRSYSDEFIFSSNVRPVVILPQARHPLLFYFWFEYAIPQILRKEKPSLFLSPDGFLSLSTPTKSLAVIHDLNFEAYPGDLPFLVSKYYTFYFPRFARKASRIATVSEYSKKDIISRYHISPDKIDVVYNGANENYTPVSEEVQRVTRNKISNGKPYFLFTGSLHPRKNIANLLKAFDGFRKSNQSDVALVLVGNKMWWTPGMESVYRDMEFQKEVIFAGRLEPVELGNVTASALAMLYVSTYEGFGIPILEAMKCDVPVITSNVTSMPEIAGDAALLVDPFSIDSIKEAMRKIYSDKNLRTELIEKGRIRREKFSWQKTADKLWACIGNTLKN